MELLKLLPADGLMQQTWKRSNVAGEIRQRKRENFKKQVNLK
jgi:hypothetical protein